MNRSLKEGISQNDLAERISKPAIRLFSIEKVRTDINRLASNSFTLSTNQELEALGNQFDELLNVYYTEERVSNL